MPKSSVIIVFILIIVIIAGFVLLTPPYAQISELRNEISALEKLQQQQREEIEFLQKEIDALRLNDPKAVEKIAREKFGYCRPGEEIYQVDIEKAPEDKEPAK